MSLPSWNDTSTNQTILNFVAAVSDENGPDYVPPVERIATFDNDGTLWCEHPIPVQFHGTLDGLDSPCGKKPQLIEQPLYKAAVEKDLAWFLPYMNNERLPELLAMLLEAAAGETTRCRVSGHGSTPHAAPWELREHTGPGQPIQWYANTPYDDDVPEHEKRILNGFTHVTFTENDVVERYINQKGDVEIEI